MSDVIDGAVKGPERVNASDAAKRLCLKTVRGGMATKEDQGIIVNCLSMWLGKRGLLAPSYHPITFPNKALAVR